MKQGDVVEFKDDCFSEAGRWCAKYGVTGLVIGSDGSQFKVRTALPYLIYALPSCVSVITHISEAPNPPKHEIKCES